MSKFWIKNNKLIKNDEDKLIKCNTCPCKAANCSEINLEVSGNVSFTMQRYLNMNTGGIWSTVDKSKLIEITVADTLETALDKFKNSTIFSESQYALYDQYHTTFSDYLYIKQPKSSENYKENFKRLNKNRCTKLVE